MNFNLLSLLRPNILNLRPYSSARDEFSGTEAILLDANENPFNHPLNRYPDPHQRELKSKISELYAVKPESIFLGNGSDEAIDLLYRAFCIPGKSNVVSIDPSYGMYEVCAHINDVAYQRVALKPDFSLDPEALLKAVNPETRLIFLCSPNNPTSNLLKKEDMLSVIRGFRGLVIVDEAYIDFSASSGLLPDLDSQPNLVILRTLSKAWGLAGIRLGMAFASADIVAILTKIKYPYNINRLSLEQAIQALSEEDKTQKWVTEILQEREILRNELDKLPFVVKSYPSDANFLLVKFTDPLAVYSFLREKGLIVRDRSRVNLCSGCLRITIGSPHENKLLIEQIRKFR